MALPQGFSEWENLQDLVRKEYNKIVRAYFKNQADDDISTPKARLKHTCLIKDEDTAAMTMMRMWLFEITVGHAQALQAPIYAIPKLERDSEITYKPQIQLFFKESETSSTYDPEYAPVTGEINFRLADETSATMTRAKAEALAKKIKQEFATPLFVWEKGWYYSTYINTSEGYHLQILAKSKTEAERIIRQVLKIQGHTFSQDYFQFRDHERTYPAVPGTHRVYGKTIKKPRTRPKANVRFRHAKLVLWGRQNAVNLVDAGGRLPSVIERV